MRPPRNTLLVVVSVLAVVGELAFPAHAGAPPLAGFGPTSGAIGASTTTAGSHLRAPLRVSDTGQNIVLILTDDQRYDSLQYMPNVESELASQGVTFTNSFDNNPLCCPSRATIMTGQTSSHNGVWYNSGPHGGFTVFLPHANQTIFAWLHEAGYRTAMIGKFLNGYELSDIPWIAPGVDEWDAMLLNKTQQGTTGCDPGGYWATCYSHNGTLETHPPTDYSTTVIGQMAVDFINTTPTDQPLFLYFAPRAPHVPTLPDSKYASACPQVQPLRPPSYNRLIVHGPAYMDALHAFTAGKQANLDLKWVDDCRTLLSVDDQVANIIQTLSAAGRLANTLILFASDNGYLFGEHRWAGKIVPYEESARVPVVVRDDALGTSGTSDAHFITNMDYTATFLQAAGLNPPPDYRFDGQSLLPLIGGSGSWTPEDEVLIEHAGGKHVPAYCGVRTPDWLFEHYATGEEELYNMSKDPYELANVASKRVNAGTLATLRADTVKLCRPKPPGFVW